MAADEGNSGVNNFNNDGSFMEKFLKMQQEKGAESTPEVKPKVPKPLPPIRKPLIMKMAKLKKPSVLVKRAKTAAVLEGEPPAELDSEQDKTGDVSGKGEISQPKFMGVLSSEFQNAQLSWVCEFSY